MAKEEQLQWERKWALPAALSALIAAVVPLAASIWAQSLLGTLPTSNSEDLFLRRVHDHSAPFVAAGVVSSVGSLGLAGVLVYLYRAVLARRPQIPKIALILAVIAPLLTAGAGIARQVAIANVADQYVSKPLPATSAAEQQKLHSITDPKKYADEVEKLSAAPARKRLTSGSIAAVTYAGLVANLLVGVAFVLIALHAMRAGLLSRFMGILGVILGALTALPVLGGTPLPVQLFWLLAMGVLFLDRWPQGRGPAWAAVEPIPWPTAQERRDALAAAAGAPARGPAARQRATEPDDDAGEPGRSEPTREAARPRTTSAHPRSKKRKRKRRG